MCLTCNNQCSKHVIDDEIVGVSSVHTKITNLLNKKKKNKRNQLKSVNSKIKIRQWNKSIPSARVTKKKKNGLYLNSPVYGTRWVDLATSLKKKQNKICNNFTAVCTWSLLEFYRIFQVQHVVRTQTSLNIAFLWGFPSGWFFNILI